MTPTPPQPVQPAVPDIPPIGDVPAPGSVSLGKSSDMIDLPRGKELSEASAMALASSRPVRWIVIAGPVDSGKTTLLVSLYELFQRGRVADFLFAGSDTLPAFEERCHLSRMASNNVEPDTTRTPYNSTPTYLHLRFGSDATPHSFVDFLFTDVSGEMFGHARDSTTACKELTFLQRAGNFLLLLDSEKALRLDKRWQMVEDAKMLLRSCLDSKMLSSDCVINIVWSKFDYIVEAGNKEEHQQFREEVAVQFRAALEGRVTHLIFSEVAARPTRAPHLGFGRGVDELLKGWITYCPRMREMNLLPELSGTRESELFARRHFKQ